MAEERVAPLAHHGWLTDRWDVGPETDLLTFGFRQVSHYLAFMASGAASFRWIHRGREQRFKETVGTVRFSPADGERHTLVATHDPAHLRYAVFTLRIPAAQLRAIADSEGLTPPPSLPTMRKYDDAVLRSCMARLAARTFPNDPDTDDLKDNAARRLVLRLLELGTHRVPDWTFDSGVFDGRTLADLVAYVDEHLQVAPTAADMAVLTSLSPSHFAKKFRASTGLSLRRFVNHRRIQTALRLLRSDEKPLAHVAFQLGFSSQSHFTHLFSDLTGMTPAKYRKQVKRIVG